MYSFLTDFKVNLRMIKPLYFFYGIFGKVKRLLYYLHTFKKRSEYKTSIYILT